MEGGVCSPAPTHTQEGKKHPEAGYQAHGCRGWQQGAHFLRHSPLGASRPQSIRGAGAQTAASGSGNIPPNYPGESFLTLSAHLPAIQVSRTLPLCAKPLSSCLKDSACSLLVLWPQAHTGRLPRLQNPMGQLLRVLPACVSAPGPEPLSLLGAPGDPATRAPPGHLPTCPWLLWAARPAAADGHPGTAWDSRGRQACPSRDALHPTAVSGLCPAPHL